LDVWGHRGDLAGQLQPREPVPVLDLEAEVVRLEVPWVVVDREVQIEVVTREQQHLVHAGRPTLPDRARHLAHAGHLRVPLLRPIRVADREGDMVNRMRPAVFI